MNERELRLLRGIRDSLIVIQEEIRSIRDQQERQGKQYNVRPVWLDPIITTHQKAETDRTTNDNRQYRVQNSLRWATWLAFIAAAAYAGISRYQLGEIQKQTVIAEQQSRPWIKVDEVTLNSPQTFSFDQNMILSPGEAATVFRPIKDPIARGAIRTKFRLKNIGKSVAQHVGVIVELFFTQSSADAIEQEQKRFCEEEGFKQAAAPAVSKSALFPDDEFTPLLTAVGWISRDVVTHRDNTDWVTPVLIGCVTYQTPRHFQTRIAYDIAGLKSGDVVLGTPLSSEQMRFIRDEQHEHAQ